MIIDDFKQKITALFLGFKQDMSGIRTNRPHAGLVEHIKVNCYGQIMPLQQVGSISIVPPRDIVIQVWDVNIVPAVLTALQNSSLGLSGNQDKNTITIHLPELSAERRDEFMKHIKRIAEDCRIKIRHMRDESNKGIEVAFKEKIIGEDQKFRQRELLQKEVDRINDEIESLVERKVKEMSI